MLIYIYRSSDYLVELSRFFSAEIEAALLPSVAALKPPAEETEFYLTILA